MTDFRKTLLASAAVPLVLALATPAAATEASARAPIVLAQADGTLTEEELRQRLEQEAQQQEGEEAEESSGEKEQPDGEAETEAEAEAPQDEAEAESGADAEAEPVPEAERAEEEEESLREAIEEQQAEEPEAEPEPQPAPEPEASDGTAESGEDGGLRDAIEEQQAEEPEAEPEPRPAPEAEESDGAAERGERRGLRDAIERRQAEDGETSDGTMSPEEEARTDELEDREAEFLRQGEPQGEEAQAEIRELRQRREAELEATAAEAEESGAEVLDRSDNRVIIRNDNRVFIQNNDYRRFTRGAERVETRELRRGLTETVITRPNGVQIVTVRDRSGDIVSRTRVTPEGREILLIDNRWDRDRRRGERHYRGERPRYRVDYYEEILPPLQLSIPREQYIVETRQASVPQIREALVAPPVEEVDGGYTLDEVLYNERIRGMVRRIDLDTVTFEFNSALIADDQIDTLDEIGQALESIVEDNPDEIFLIEGHTDAPGTDLYNLELSDRRAENVAVILTDYFEIPPENLITHGYGEGYLKVDTQAEERANRRVTIRRITPLLQAQAQ